MSTTSRIWHRLLLRASLAMAQIFSWVLIFRYFIEQSGTLEAAIVSVALTYALTQVITVLVTPAAASALRNGYHRLMALAVVSLAAALTLLAAALTESTFAAGWGITGFAILMGVYRAFYWAPYRLALEKNPGKNPLWSVYLLALIPLLAGFVLESGALSIIILLAISASLALLSLVPLFSMPDAHEGFAWSYRESFHQLFVRAHRRMTLASILHGIEMSLLLVVWPIIVFVILGWSFALLGLVLSIIYILSIVVRAAIGRPMMSLSAPTRALYAASAWIMRLSVVGSVGVILVDVFYYGGSNASSRGLDIMTLEHAADNTTYVDEYTVLKEVSMAIGRLTLSLAVAVLASHMSITYTIAIVFFIGALAAAGGVMLSTKRAGR